MLTDCPVRLFEVLDTFVASDRQTWGDATGEEGKYNQSPAEVNKGRLMSSMELIETFFVNFA